MEISSNLVAFSKNTNFKGHVAGPGPFLAQCIILGLYKPRKMKKEE